MISVKNSVSESPNLNIVLRGRKLLLLEVQSHAEMISSRATNPTYSHLIYWRNGLYLFSLKRGRAKRELKAP